LKFSKKLTEVVRKNKSLLCVGLDPDPAQMPEKINIFEFNRAIIDATSDLVCAYKPNFAFYEACGKEGLEALKRTVDYVPEGIPVIGDAKRGDIGNTARAYARAIFDYYGFDATTVNPYMGFDSVEPFLQYRHKGIFILCRTSNPGTADFQSINCEAGGSHRQLFKIVAEKASQWNSRNNAGLVIGATMPEELMLIRDRYPDMPLLIPGVGAQGGDLNKVLRCGLDNDRVKTIINSSRQIIYASRGSDFAEAARLAAKELRDSINQVLDTLPTRKTL
jgi:orotidine-5'-phosphate decarboxylase